MVSIAKLQVTTVLIYPDIVGLFDIYTYHIRPLLDSKAIALEQSNACSKLTYFIKEEEKWFLLNNFELFRIAKSPYIDFDVLRKEVAVKHISKNQFNFDISFYELINLIAQHNKTIDIRLVYSQLNEILNREINKKLFGKNTFTIATFCRLINISEQTYYKRPSESVL
ncbi:MULTISPECIES: hypothetical protein [Psychrobacter]|uniref:hypothetical protein n=1 Tax=Psychrobacter TaxID=497 RepID=UPI000ED0EF09|nr:MULTISPECIES: hypothetical protein [Psychrobacter]HCN17543.1 hypothetical protein [Psychrobacter sp.]